MKRALIAVLVCGLAFLALAAPPAGAAEDDITIAATLAGREVEGAGSNDPVRLDPREIVDVELEVTNTTGADLVIRRARLYGEAFGLTFVAYDAVIDVPLAAGESKVIEIPVEFIDLERQATGLLPGGFALYDADREVIGRQSFVIDVRGSATSALGVFGIFVTVATAVGIVGIVIGVQRRTLGPNRLRRAVRFAFVGLGVGLTLVVGLAVFRIVAPTGAVWIPLTLIPTAVAAVLGFVSPGPLAAGIDDDDDWDDDEDIDTDEPTPVGAAG